MTKHIPIQTGYTSARKLRYRGGPETTIQGLGNYGTGAQETTIQGPGNYGIGAGKLRYFAFLEQ